jgi:hypothetical protein
MALCCIVGDITITARKSGILGALTMGGDNVNLDLASLLARSGGANNESAYSVCVCSTGRLYLASAGNKCPETEPSDCTA